MKLQIGIERKEIEEMSDLEIEESLVNWRRDFDAWQGCPEQQEACGEVLRHLYRVRDARNKKLKKGGK